jgi:hypothetical protein
VERANSAVISLRLVKSVVSTVFFLLSCRAIVSRKYEYRYSVSRARVPWFVILLDSRLIASDVKGFGKRAFWFLASAYFGQSPRLEMKLPL